MEQFLAKYMPPDYSAHGHQLDQLNAVVHWLMLILFVAWGGYFLYVLWRFNAKRHKKASYGGMQSHFTSYVEAGVAVIEVILLVGFSIPLWSKWTHKPGPETNPLVIRVVAEQFAWNVHYPGKDGKFGRSDPKLMTSTNPLGIDPNDPDGKDDVTSLNQLHLEVNRPVIINLSSKDVIHSFSLPVMRVKQDAIPGQGVAIHFTPVRTTNGDKWEIACAQLCGLGHYRMRGQLEVHSKADFEKWLASQAPQNPATPEPNPVPAAAPATPAEAQPGGGPTQP
jgi:cytochrome c oxidase subunit 2